MSAPSPSDTALHARALAAKKILASRHASRVSEINAAKSRSALLEQNLEKDVTLTESNKNLIRRTLAEEESFLMMERRKKMSVQDFQSLQVIGRGAFGEVRLVRRVDDRAGGSGTSGTTTSTIYALKVRHSSEPRMCVSVASASVRRATALGERQREASARTALALASRSHCLARPSTALALVSRSHCLAPHSHCLAPHSHCLAPRSHCLAARLRSRKLCRAWVCVLTQCFLLSP